MKTPHAKTTSRIGTACLAITLLGLSLSTADGAQPGRRRTRFAAPQRSASTRLSETRPSRTRASRTQLPSGISTFSPYDMWMDGYPKYYGGFHARYFTEMLYPTGDRPFRGTAW
jgi:hypothetical protein